MSFIDNKKCHPSIQDNKFTCYNHNQLKNIAIDLNKKGYNIKMKRSKKDLWTEIKKSMMNQCKDEWCWLKETDTSIKKNKVFRPKHPNEWLFNRTAWLSNFDIEDVLTQYEDLHDDFLFIGPVPIDFKLVIDELSNINLIKLYREGIRKIGIVFNLDTHDKGGSHWVSMFIDMTDRKQGAVCYYDSYGYLPEMEISDLITTLMTQGNNGFDGKGFNKDEKIVLNPYFNAIRHQYKHSECGTYCMYFIIKMLESKNKHPYITFENLCTNRIDDDTMNAIRYNYFITYYK